MKVKCYRWIQALTQQAVSAYVSDFLKFRSLCRAGPILWVAFSTLNISGVLRDYWTESDSSVASTGKRWKGKITKQSKNQWLLQFPWTVHTPRLHKWSELRENYHPWEQFPTALMRAYQVPHVQKMSLFALVFRAHLDAGSQMPSILYHLSVVLFSHLWSSASGSRLGIYLHRTPSYILHTGR